MNVPCRRGELRIGISVAGPWAGSILGQTQGMETEVKRVGPDPTSLEILPRESAPRQKEWKSYQRESASTLGDGKSFPENRRRYKKTGNPMKKSRRRLSETENPSQRIGADAKRVEIL